MSQIIQLKRSEVAGKVPESLALGELALNIPDKKLYISAAGYEFSTRQVREVLGPEVSLAEPDVFSWLRDYLSELEQSLDKKE